MAEKIDNYTSETKWKIPVDTERWLEIERDKLAGIRSSMIRYEYERVGIDVERGLFANATSARAKESRPNHLVVADYRIRGAGFAVRCALCQMAVMAAECRVAENYDVAIWCECHGGFRQTVVFTERQIMDAMYQETYGGLIEVLAFRDHADLLRGRVAEPKSVGVTQKPIEAAPRVITMEEAK